MNKLLYTPFLSCNAITAITEQLKKDDVHVQLSGIIDAGLANAIGVFSCDYPYRVIITHSEQSARDLFENLKYFDENVYYFPSKDFIFYSADVSGNSIVSDRINAIKGILSGNATIITTGSGLMDKLIPLSYIEDNSFIVNLDSIVELDEISKKLTNLGYEHTDEVTSRGQFSIRGSIIDLFPLTEDTPYRIDLFDNEVDSIKTFDSESQRTIENVDHVHIFPSSEYVLSNDEIEKGIELIKKDLKKQHEKLRAKMLTEEAHRLLTHTNEFIEQLTMSREFVALDSYISYFYKDTQSLFDYLPQNTLYMSIETSRVAEHMESVLLEFKDSMSNRLEKGYILPLQADVLFTPKHIYSKLASKKCIHFTTLDSKIKHFDIAANYSMSMQNITPMNKNMELFTKELKRYIKNKYFVVILTGSKTRGLRFASDLRDDYDIACTYIEDACDIPSSGIIITRGNISNGYEFTIPKLAVISENDIFGSANKRKKKKRTSHHGQTLTSFTDLSIGDYVIHENYGLGVYKGMEKMVVDRIEKDYVKIEYAAGGNLYVPVSSLDLIQKYASADSKKPKLNKLGTKEWKETKSRVRSNVANIAKELVNLYAKRQQKDGHVFSEDTLWQKEFEELFPYEETVDQLNAISDTKKDMESTKIMDRLICGDVGFGKTEVAIRAAFKAAMDGKQVVVLAPTTILAGQHYNNFIERMKDFPVTIELMSRFRTAAKQKATIEGLKTGHVDIVIGTHRLLSKDISYKNLGLLIIDEEQRFGVAHKEKIKQLRENVDVLALSATPIPRTLHMSLVGIRDMSVLEEPPVDRIPIQTFVMEHNPEMVREAINRELARGGQVYYVYNRVSSIEDITMTLRELLPDATIEYAHGQMSERKLEQIMSDFITGDIDVLVSTTIIETGLDIANVNTMIIHDADKLGLSQLYQLRGRIGRSNRTAYAFLMYRKDKLLKEVAEKRLLAIKEFTDLGSGFKIALRDLEIRGAGNVLGAEQSGHMEAVGYDLYCKMLNEAVSLLKGDSKPKEDFETTIDINIDAFIPATYIKNELQKLSVYKRIACIETNEEYEDMEDELMDRFGEIPRPVINLLDIALLKSMAHKAFIQEVTGNKSSLTLKMYGQAPIDINKIPALLSKYNRELKFIPGATPYFTFTPKNKTMKINEYFTYLFELFMNMGTLEI